MSKILDITENHLKILSLFTKGYDGEYYIREICRHVPLSHGTAHNILSSFEEKGVFDSEIKGRNKVFRLKKNTVAINHILLAESYKRLKFSENYPLIDDILFRIMPFFDSPLALFGSYAYGGSDEFSDIDLFSAGDFDKNEVDKIARKFRIEINVKKYQKELFYRSMNEDHLIKEVYRNHIYLRCPEFFIYRRFF